MLLILICELNLSLQILINFVSTWGIKVIYGYIVVQLYDICLECVLLFKIVVFEQ